MVPRPSPALTAPQPPAPTEPAAAVGFNVTLLDRRGGSRPVDPAALDARVPAEGVLWYELHQGDPAARGWLRDRSGLDPLVVEALLAEETRPRWFAAGEGLLVILRGVNVNPGADPDDMVSLRLWLEPGRIITVRMREVMAARDMHRALDGGRGPTGARDMLVELADLLVARTEPVIEALGDAVGEIEDALLDGAPDPALGPKLAGLRRTAVRLRRYLAPQREVLTQLAAGQAARLQERDRARLREAADRITRYLEALDAAREHAAVTQEELLSRLAERTNRTAYLLTVIATVFLPLGFITGLLGINVGGIPGSASPHAFALVCALMLVLVALELWLLRRLRWL